MLLAHPGTQYSYALALQLYRQGLLHRFATGLVFGQNFTGWLPGRLKRRIVPGLPHALLHRQPWPEIRALLHMRQGKIAEPVLLRRNQRFQQGIPQKLLAASSGVVGFDTSAWLLARRAKALGKPLLLDVSIAHSRSKEAIYRMLRMEYPEWAEDLPLKSTEALAREEEEHQAAHKLVVASAFTADTLVAHGVPRHKIILNPYGTDIEGFSNKWELPAVAEVGSKTAERGLVFGFLGLISARKGIPWLLRVWPRLRHQYPNSRLLLGGYGAPPAGLRLPPGVELTGYIPPAQRETFFHKLDVFVFPSFFEGFGQVIIEAMACGLPVITTPHTVGPQVIGPGQKEGRIVHTGNDGELLEALSWFAQNPALLPAMGQAARQAVLPLTWQAYGQRWGQIIREHT